MARRKPPAPPPHRLILDSGAVIALSRREHRARAALTAAWEIGAEVIVPAVVVTETTRGNAARDAAVNRVMTAIGHVAPTTEERARTAGVLLGKARSNAVLDALVVAEAVGRGGGVILTGDVKDLGALAAAHDTVIVHGL